MYAENEDFPYHIVLEHGDFKQKKEMYAWCKSTWGEPNYLNKLPNIWTFTGHNNLIVFKFKHEQDRTIFLLRWSCNKVE